MSKEYTESDCISKLERLGCKFSGMRVLTVPRSRLGLKALGMVDYLANTCRLVIKYV